MRIHSMWNRWSPWGESAKALFPNLFRVGCVLTILVAMVGTVLAQVEEPEPVGDFTVDPDAERQFLQGDPLLSSLFDKDTLPLDETPAAEPAPATEPAPAEPEPTDAAAAEMQRLMSAFLELAKQSGIPAKELEKDDWVQTLLKPRKFEKTEAWQKRLESYGEIPIGFGLLDVESYDADTERGDWHFIPVIWPFLDAEQLASAIANGSESEYQPQKIYTFGTISLPLDECVSLSEEGNKPVLAYPVTAKVYGFGRDQVDVYDGHWQLPDRMQAIPWAGKPFTNSLGMQFNRIPAGTFTMGSPGDGDERQHEVTLSRDYYMGVYEVTQGEWKRVMGENPSKFKGDRNPVEQVSWEDCQKFVDKLNAQYKEELEQKLGAGWHYSLPSEAEWEYACRGGTTGSYGGTGNLETMGWYTDNSGKTTHAVGGKKPNGYGLYDMHGNVAEWCSDWYGDYPSGSVTDPPGVSSGSNRVCRGGSWDNNAGYCRSARRDDYAPASRYGSLGVRLSLSSR